MQLLRTTFAAAAFSLLACSTALAATPAAPGAATGAGSSLIAQTRTAVVNIQGIMHDATAAKSVREALDAKQKVYQAEISKKKESLRKEKLALQQEQQGLPQQQSAMSKEAFEKKVAAFEAKVKAFEAKETAAQQEVKDKKATLDGGFEHALNQIQQTVGQIINEMAKDKGFVMVFPTSQMLYADASLDISQDVLTKLNARLPKVAVKFEAASADATPAPSVKHKK